MQHIQDKQVEGFPCFQALVGGFTEDEAIGAFVSEVFAKVMGFCFVEFGDKALSLLAVAGLFYHIILFGVDAEMCLDHLRYFGGAAGKLAEAIVVCHDELCALSQ